MANESRWRTESRRVIAETLAQLPATADIKTKRKALRTAYPFGSREHHPYKIWCSEQAKVLGTKSEQAKAPTVRVNPVAMKVECEWCDSEDCLCCLVARQTLERLGPLTDWTSWQDWEHRLEAFPDESSIIRAQYADWLEENGWQCVAKGVRHGQTNPGTG